MMSEVNNLSPNDMSLPKSVDPDTSVAKHVGRLQLVRDQQENNTSIRDKMALTSVAMCSPLMLIGLGAAFSVADELDVLKDGTTSPKTTDRGIQFRADAAQALAYKEKLAAIEAKEKARLQIRTTNLSAPIEIPHQRKRKIKDTQTNTRDSMIQNRFTDRNSLKMKKLMKQKQALLDYLEENRGKLDLKTVSGLISKIELLDKALKRYG
jgi:hypothetical protein